MLKWLLFAATFALVDGFAQTSPWGQQIPEVSLFADRIQFLIPEFVITEGMDKASVLKAIGSNARSRVLDQHLDFFKNITNIAHDSWMPALPVPEITSCGRKCVMEPTEFSLSFSPSMKLYVVFAGRDVKSLRAAMMYVHIRPAVAEEGARMGNQDVEAFLVTPDRRLGAWRLGNTGTVQASSTIPKRPGKK